MPAERFYLSSSLLEKTRVSLSNEEFHHLHKVMRLQVHDEVELINGQGSLAIAEILSFEKNQATLTIKSSSTSLPSKQKLTLIQAIPRQPRLEYIIEKSVELGVTDLLLFPGTYSEKKELSPHQIERVHTIIINAMKQCGRLFIPSLKFLPAISEWSKVPTEGTLLFGDTSKTAPHIQTLVKHSSSTGIIIGPEKGFHSKELEFFKHLNIIGASLHTNILRVDTAAICALSIASNLQ